MADRPNPFADIEQFFEQMNRTFGDVGIPTRPHEMAVDVAETESEIVVSADLPGFEREEVTISLSGRDLTIDADHEAETEEHDGDDGDTRYVRRERTHRAVSRTVRLPDAVDEEAASASYTNGVLTVTLPRETVDEEDSHTIDIS